MHRSFATLMVAALCLSCSTVKSVSEDARWSDRVALSMATHGEVSPQDPTRVPVQFSFTPGTPAESVHLTGSFANWNATAVPMSDEDGDGTWTVTHGLLPGEHLYKFVVDETEWLSDPNNPDLVDDNHQGFNSRLVVRLADQSAIPEAAHDGHVEASFLHHNPGLRAHLERTGDSTLRITLRTLRDDLTSAHLLWGSGETPDSAPLEWIYSDDLFDHYRADLDLINTQCLLGYAFVAEDGEDRAILDASGTHSGDVGPPLPFAVDVAALPLRRAPEWAMDAVWYQIFPERFRNGDPSNDEPNALPWTWSWYERYTADEEENFSRRIFERRFGGDLQGVIEKLDYLEDLGVTAIYFNPVFEAQSLHKYEATDFRHIDDNFGVLGDNRDLQETPDPATWVFTPSDRVFLDLLRDCHERGMHVIIDGVFNHTGARFWAFRDVLEHGAESEYAGWYQFTSLDPPQWEGWEGHHDLPEFAQDENGLVEPVAEHVLAVTRRWMDPNGDGNPIDGLDGWRLDVPNLIPRPFWRRWHSEVVRAINPESYTLGELWGRDAGWVTPDLFDAHMNYAWTQGVYRFFVNDGQGNQPRYSPSEFNRYLFELHSLYDWPTNLIQFNLLDSHDTDRIASALLNPNRDFDQSNRVGPESAYDGSRPGPDLWRRLKLIWVFQFTSVGAPSIWYGDEVGMWGADDPDCRKPMLWADLAPYDDPDAPGPDMDLHRHVRTLAHLRQDLPALRRGLLRPALLDDATGIYAFERRLSGRPSADDVYVVLNRSDASADVELPVHWPDGLRVFDALSERLVGATQESAVINGSVRLTVGPEQGAILVSRE